MTFIKNWEDFERNAEKLYLSNPNKVRYTMKYKHAEGVLILKFTDDAVCLQFKTEIHQDLKRVDRFINNLMRHMAGEK
uniref:Signal recognition particle 9 kDa protein n=1 Tax=Eubosmina coregoni TaxID=186181 RepID=A0A4Y7LRN1_9CRUS|nr:EOG090X0OQY [Eubosmina coregoni]